MFKMLLLVAVGSVLAAVVRVRVVRFALVSGRRLWNLSRLLCEPHLPSLFTSHFGIGSIDTAVCGRTNASCTNAKHQTIVDNVAVEAWIVALQTLCGDTVGVGDAFTRVLVGALVDELAVVSVATETEL